MNPLGQVGRSLNHRLESGTGLRVARGLSYAAIALIVAGLIWCSLAKIDLVVTAPGRLVVRGEPVHISAPERGAVVEIAVKIGQRVAAGDVLARLDSFKYESDAHLLGQEIRAFAVEQCRHVEAANGIRPILESLQTERAAATQQVQFVTRQLERAEALKSQGIVSAEEVERCQSQLLAARNAIAHLESDVHRNQSMAKDREQQAAEVVARIQALQAKRDHFLECARRMTITSPCPGVISDLSIRRPGLTAIPEQPFVTIIPEQEDLLARVVIPNRSIRGIHPELPVRVSADAFPKDDFGYLEYEVASVEPDATDAGQYIAWLKLGPQRQNRPNFVGNLRPGLEVKAQIIVERRKLIDLLFRPLRRATAEPLNVGMP